MTDLFPRIKRRRSKVRPGRKKGKQMAEMRGEVFERDGERCVTCGAFVGQDGHLAHKRNKRMWGDSPENTAVECPKCHYLYHQYGPSRVKPCKAKERRA